MQEGYIRDLLIKRCGIDAAYMDIINRYDKEPIALMVCNESEDLINLNLFDCNDSPKGVSIASLNTEKTYRGICDSLKTNPIKAETLIICNDDDENIAVIGNVGSYSRIFSPNKKNKNPNLPIDSILLYDPYQLAGLSVVRSDVNFELDGENHLRFFIGKKSKLLFFFFYN